ncbi:uncharacterized protein N7503_001352 [Penicillium pulvis]|uniref:uncharacterized protein n=1 Tax=Penicillium pulvis TaxID=1562058 RepID=UPI0025479D88|nr:uncharacterized protein N7503_001352 [Penicillium pulvis]KAJ5809134.1 hypothetical protein N7503_001352 [Penicillium pulvis]
MKDPMDLEFQTTLGPIHYVKKTESWSFPRPSKAPSFSYTGVTKTVIPSPPRTSSPEPLNTSDRPQGIKRILKKYPDLRLMRFPWSQHYPWSKRFPGHFRELPELLPASNENYTSHVSSLLDLGYAAIFPPRDSSHISIAATVTGEGRNIISLRVIVEDTWELSRDRSAVCVPAISDEETTEWSRPGALIQQVCFARPPEGEKQGTLMAARLLDSTMLFRPLYRNAPVAPANLYHSINPSLLRTSRLDANPLVEIPITWTGGYPHADMAFNPHQDRLAIIDVQGNWSIWEIETEHKEGKANAFVVAGPRGSMSSLDPIGTDNNKHRCRGSIQWVNASTVLVADRRTAVLFHLEGNESRALELKLKSQLGMESLFEMESDSELETDAEIESDADMESQLELILDVKKSTHRTSLFFILTSTRLLLFDMRNARDEEGRPLPLEASLIWRFDGYVCDRTSRLSDLLIGDYLYLVLYSRRREMVRVFPYTETKGFVRPDSFLLKFQPPLDPSSIESIEGEHFDNPPRYSTFVFKEVAYSPVGIAPHPEMTLIKLFWVDKSLAVHETLFKGPAQMRKRNEEKVNGNILRASKSPFARVLSRIYDDFVVDDWNEDVRPPQTRARKARLIKPKTLYEDLRWTLNFTPLYKHALKGIAGCVAQVKLERSRPSFDRILRNLAKTANAKRQCQSIFQISGRPMSNDIEQSIDDTKRLMSILLPEHPNLTPHQPYMILRLPSSDVISGMPVASQAKQSSLDFLEIYDKLIDQWLTSLPPTIPYRTRRMKERIIRGIALDMFLARIIQTPKEAKVAKSSKDMVQAGPASSQLPSSQNTELEYRSSQQGPENEKAPADFRSLSGFIVFKKPRPLRQKVVNVLSHWQVGADPSTYNWRQVTQAQEGGPPQHRVRKKRSRQSQLSQTPVAPPSLRIPSTPQIRTWGSQPDQRFPASSQPSISDKFMTQTERGQFGARKLKSTKKRKRAEGF